MTVREFRIKCPMCEGLIVVDARSGHLIRHWEADEREEDEKPDPAEFDKAVDKVNRFKEETESTFGDAMKKISDRKKGLDDLFNDAQKKAKEKGDEDRPEDHPDFWD